MPAGRLLGGGRLGGPGERVLRHRVVLGGGAGQQGSVRAQAGPLEARPRLHLGPGAWACERRRGPAFREGSREPRPGGHTVGRAGAAVASEVQSGVAVGSSREEAVDLAEEIFRVLVEANPWHWFDDAVCQVSS